MEPTVGGARGDFHARIREVEKGVFRAEYQGELNPVQNTENPSSRQWPDYHLSDSLQAAKTWVENLAREMNYNRVVWDSLPD